MLNESCVVGKTVCGSLLDCWVKLENCEDSLMVHLQYLPMGEQEIWYYREDKTVGLISTNYGDEIYTDLILMPMSELLAMDSLNFDEQVVMTIIHRYY